jgi:hypothetical protein
MLAAGAWLAAGWLLPTLAYKNGDSITRARIDTERRLFRYEIGGSPEALRRWLTAYHGEAPSQQAMYSLGEWSLSHPRQFRSLVEGLDAKRQAPFAEGFAFALSDADQDDALMRTFRGDRSPVVRMVLRRLRLAR